MLWKTCAITLAAQILTTPVCMYYFHQFPNLFLAANLVAIPLSSAILILEIVLCCIAFFPMPALLTGQLIGWLIRMMNSYIELIDGHSFANWSSLQITSLQLILLYIIIAGLAYWLLERKKRALYIALYAATFFFILRTTSFFKHARQHHLIVYNVPRLSAIEVMKGRSAWFLADSALLQNESQIQFHIKPARIYYRVAHVSHLTRHNNEPLVYASASKSVLIAGSPVLLTEAPDVLIITGSPPGSIGSFIRGKLPKLVVFDSSNPQWKVIAWTAQCVELGVPAFSVQHHGAFVMNLN